jgi:uncharacterized membrane protein YkvA (DUF1232 family)
MALDRLRRWARDLRRDVVALWIVARAAETPLAAKLIAGAVAAYALSPIDLIPDFIPVLGLVDDLVIVPLGIALAIRLVPPAQLAAARTAAAVRADRPVSRVAAVSILALWGVLAALAFATFVRWQ